MGTNEMRAKNGLTSLPSKPALITEVFCSLIFFVGLVNELMLLLFSLVAPFLFAMTIAQIALNWRISPTDLKVLIFGAAWFLSICKMYLLFGLALSSTRAICWYCSIQTAHLLASELVESVVFPFPVVYIFGCSPN